MKKIGVISFPKFVSEFHFTVDGGVDIHQLRLDLMEDDRNGYFGFSVIDEDRRLATMINTIDTSALSTKIKVEDTTIELSVFNMRDKWGILIE